MMNKLPALRARPRRKPVFDRIAFDVKRMRPGCVLIQAALGCDSRIANEFPVESWLDHTTEHMHVYSLSGNQLAQLVGMAKKRLTEGAERSK